MADVFEAGREEILRRIAPDHGANSGRCEIRAAAARFLDVLVSALRHVADAQGVDPARAWREGACHGGVLPGMGLQDHVVLDGILFQVLDESRVAFGLREMHTLSACLLASAVAEAAAHVGEREARVRRQAGNHVAFLAHELRNPLSSLMLAFHGLKKPGLLPGGERTVAIIDRGFAQMRDLIDGALVEVKLSSVAAPDLREVELSGFLNDLIEEMLVNADQKAITIHLDSRATTLTADPKYIHSALSNLLRNAIKFSRRGATLRLRVRALQQRVVFEVEDECGGLPPDVQGKLFDPFVQVGDDRSGFGLGLAIARQAVEVHGGTLRVRDRPGRGCTFSMDLPIDGRAPVAVTAS